MEYEEYLEKTKKFVKKSTLGQRISAGIAILILLVGYIVYLDPAKKLLEMRNSQRRADVVNILNSVYQFSVDNDGELPASITSVPTMICKSESLSCDGLVDISEIITNKKYLLSAVPVDPKENDQNVSGYQISKLTSGRISVTAPLAENNAVISLSK